MKWSCGASDHLLQSVGHRPDPDALSLGHLEFLRAEFLRPFSIRQVCPLGCRARESTRGHHDPLQPPSDAIATKWDLALLQGLSERHRTTVCVSCVGKHQVCSPRQGCWRTSCQWQRKTLTANVSLHYGQHRRTAHGNRTFSKRFHILEGAITHSNTTESNFF